MALTRTVQLTVRLDPAQADKLERLAQKYDISASSLLRQLVQDLDEATGQLRKPK